MCPNFGSFSVVVFEKVAEENPKSPPLISLSFLQRAFLNLEGWGHCSQRGF